MICLRLLTECRCYLLEHTFSCTLYELYELIMTVIIVYL